MPKTRVAEERAQRGCLWGLTAIPSVVLISRMALLLDRRIGAAPAPGRAPHGCRPRQSPAGNPDAFARIPRFRPAMRQRCAAIRPANASMMSAASHQNIDDNESDTDQVVPIDRADKLALMPAAIPLCPGAPGGIGDRATAVGRGTRSQIRTRSGVFA